MEAVQLKHNDDFMKQSFSKAVFPCMLTVLSANINVFADGILVGSRIGAEALAAINISLPLFLFMCVVGSLFSSGTAINASKEIGKNNIDEAVEYYQTSVIVLFAASIIFTILGLLLRNPIVLFLSPDKDIQKYLMEYIVITLIGALPKIMIYIPLWYLRLDGKNIAVMIMMGVLSIGNVILDILMVYFLDMGVFGAGLASVIATAIALVIGVFCLLDKDSTFVFKPNIIRDKDRWKLILKAGTPSALNNLTSTIRILMINSFLFSIGGKILVAVFGAINGVYGIGEAIVLGVPQAASAMMGLFIGERDNTSTSTLIKLEIKMGCIYSAIFMGVTLLGHKFIQNNMYHLDTPILVPLIWMTASVFFGVLCSVLQGYYNVSGKDIWSNVIILFRMLLMPFIGLCISKSTGFSPFFFMLLGEAGTFVIWYFAAGLYNKKKPNLSPYLFMDRKLEQSGKVLDFSVENSDEKICEASERISDFCSSNGLGIKNTMALQLAVEELLSIISSVNKKNGPENSISFDLRAYSVDGVQGIRVRYNGVMFNPFDEKDQDEDMFMGVSMIKKLVEICDYTKTIGFNTIMIILKEEK